MTVKLKYPGTNISAHNMSKVYQNELKCLGTKICLLAIMGELCFRHICSFNLIVCLLV